MTQLTFTKSPSMLAPLLLTAVTLGLTAPAGAQNMQNPQNTQNPFQRLFGSQKKPTPPPPAPLPLREDTYRLAEILVELSWLGDPITFPYFIEARVVGANLQVRGNVPSKAVRDHAMKLATLNTPMPVVDMLKENPRLAFRPARLTPDQLQKVAASGLREALPKKAKNLQPRCSADGRVAIVGNVDSFEQKLLVSQTIRRIHGATVVTNLVRVGSDPDGSIAQAMARSLPTTVATADARGSAPVVDDPRRAPGEIPLPNANNPTVVVGSSPAAAADVRVEAQPPPPANKSKLSIAQLTKRVEKACPGAREVKLTLISPGEIRVDLYARTAADTKLPEQVFTVQELVDNYRLDLHLILPEK